jgi:hypothetical protein
MGGEGRGPSFADPKTLRTRATVAGVDPESALEYLGIPEAGSGQVSLSRLRPMAPGLASQLRAVKPSRRRSRLDYPKITIESGNVVHPTSRTGRST